MTIDSRRAIQARHLPVLRAPLHRCAPSLAALHAVAAFGCSSPEPPPAPRPSVLIAIYDDVADADIDRIATPAFDALAARGLRFDRAYASPVCSPARRQLLFGVFWAKDAGDPCTGEWDPSTAPDPDDLSLPRLFARAGYRTALFGKWHLGGHPGTETGAPWEEAARVHGFETWRAGLGSNIRGNYCPEHNGFYDDWHRVDDGTSSRTSVYQTEAMRDAFLDWYAGVAGSPWFAVLSFQGPHAPYHVPPAFAASENERALDKRAKYELMLTDVDRVFGEILAALSDEPLVLLVGDNGTPQGALHASQSPGRAKQSTYEDGIRVPLVWAGPGVRTGRSRTLVSFVDVLPTLAEWIRSDVQLPATLDGHSMSEVLRNEDRAIREYAWAGSFEQDDYAVVTARWKYRQRDGERYLFDLEADPAERTNLAGLAPHAETERDLAEKLARHRPD